MNPRGVALIAVALVLSAGLLGVQLASGGADFVPQRPADPCQDRPPASHDEDNLEALAQTIVLTGVDEAACKLGVSRERLLLALPSQKDRAELARETGTDERGLAQALQDGLRTGIDRLDRTGQLPKTSALLPSLADQLGVSKTLVEALPDSLVDDLLPTDDVLRRAVDKIDMNTVLANLDDRQTLESTLREALVQAAIDEVKAKIKDALPGPFGGLFG
jgi:hypothetical protein